MDKTTAVALTKVDQKYVSVFEDPSTFPVKMKIADALSRTPFVPESFRGKAEDCLVALDMAGRLGLNPLAVFPDIYVIDNRASFSSKFLIALVNRSGRFSRIRFEEGIDGEAEVTFSGWGEQRGQRKTWKEKVPNYWSIATFKELASGEVFTSPRIDMRFAEKNGWIQKAGSKWQTMPQIMCRYRSASILIKSTCPEIVMGMEWADDVADAREEKPVVLEQPTEKPDALHIAIENATNQDDLREVGKMIAATSVSPSDLNELRTEFKRRMTELPSLKEWLKGRIDSDDDQESLRNEIEIATTTGKLSGADYGELIDAWKSKRDEDVPDADIEPVEVSQEPEPEGTEEQLKWGRKACELIRDATSDDNVRARLADAHEWLQDGYITPAIYSKIEEYAKQKVEQWKNQ